MKKKILYSLGIVLLIIIGYNAYITSAEYFDKDGRFVLHGELKCTNISRVTLMEDGNVFLLTSTVSFSFHKKTRTLKFLKENRVWNIISLQKSNLFL